MFDVQAKPGDPLWGDVHPRRDDGFRVLPPRQAQGVVAGMEVTSKPNPLADLLSGRLMSKGYASWSRMSSSYLLTR
ncbi:hypothetical protein ACIBG8_38475 [Nonomuraea sp. NPDC050556]|uniref:hypothetical protein n=1 Tax=Nonomuraea sp. NPDC050556 TaxID=3364369 RepID=UPI0037B140B1